MNYTQQAFAIAKQFQNENETPIRNENEISFANELRNEIRNEVEMTGGNELEMNNENEPEMNHGNEVEMNVKKIVEMNRRTTTTTEQVIQLKKTCNYTNFHSSIWFGNGKHWIEGTFYKGNLPVYQFRINCKSENDCRQKLNQIRRCYP